MQGAYFRSHARLVNQHINISQGLQIDVPSLYFFQAQRRVQKARSPRSTSRTILILFTRATLRTKSKELPIDVPFHPYTFYTCSTAYKRQGAPDRCPIPSAYFLCVHCYIFQIDISLCFSYTSIIGV
jgi:hypothetical protein